MKAWRLIAPLQLKETTFEDNSPLQPNQARVKVSHVLFTDVDALTYTGDIKANYPVILGRSAVGIVIDKGENCFNLEKDKYVLIQPVTPCEKCETCASGDEEECPTPLIAGLTKNGYLRSTIIDDESLFLPLPSALKIKEALCTEFVAICEAAIDKLDVKKGSKVAVVGGGLLGNILCQLLIYHQIVPVLIENNAHYIENAKQSGVYYIFNSDDELMANIKEVTGGRLLDGVVYISSSKMDTSLPMLLCKDNRNVVLCGFASLVTKMDVTAIFKRNLTLSAVSNGFGYTKTALNLLNNSAVSLDHIPLEMISENEISETLKKRSDNVLNGRERTASLLKLII